jgi:hypothetical protein
MACQPKGARTYHRIYADILPPCSLVAAAMYLVMVSPTHTMAP